MSLRGHREIAVGNVVGSNLFNLTGVLGISGLVGSVPLEVSTTLLRFDLPVMTAAAVACCLVMFSGGPIDRREGGSPSTMSDTSLISYTSRRSEHDCVRRRTHRVSRISWVARPPSERDRILIRLRMRCYR